MSVVVYGPRGAPFTAKVLGALALKGLSFELREPSGPEDYRRWSPETGLLPAAEIAGERVADSARILDALERHQPEPPLLAEDPTAAAAQRRLERWVEETFFFYWERWLRERVERELAAGSKGDGRSPLQRTLARVGLSGRGARGGGLRAEAGLAAEFERRLDDLVNFLGGRPYFYAERIGRADLAVNAFLTSEPVRTARSVASAVEARPALVAHGERVARAVAESEPAPRGAKAEDAASAEV